MLRVVLDSNLRTPLDSKLVATAKDNVIIFFTDAGLAAQQSLKKCGIRLECLPSANERVPLAAAIKRLGSLEITSLLIEGGAEINAAALKEDVADKLALFYAPIFLGQDAVPMMASGAGLQTIPNRAKDFTLRKFGDDFAFEAYLRDPSIGVE